MSVKVNQYYLLQKGEPTKHHSLFQPSLKTQQSEFYLDLDQISKKSMHQLERPYFPMTMLTEPSDRTTQYESPRAQLAQKIKSVKSLELLSNISKETSSFYQERVKHLDNIYSYKQSQLSLECPIFQPQKVAPKTPRALDTLIDGALLEANKNQFVYVKVFIKDKPSPIMISFIIEEGPKNTELRIFGSTISPTPNRFNCETEASGKVLRFSEGALKRFQCSILYLGILAMQNVLLKIRIKYQLQIQQKSQKTIQQKKQVSYVDIFEQMEYILYQRKLRMSVNKNIEQYKFKNRVLKIEKNKKELQEKIFRTKWKQQEIMVDQKIEKVAKLKLHDVASEMIDRKMDIELKRINKLFFEHNWVNIIYLVGSIALKIKQKFAVKIYIFINISTNER